MIFILHVKYFLNYAWLKMSDIIKNIRFLFIFPIDVESIMFRVECVRRLISELLIWESKYDIYFTCLIHSIRMQISVKAKSCRFNSFQQEVYCYTLLIKQMHVLESYIYLYMLRDIEFCDFYLCVERNISLNFLQLQ